MSEHGILVEVEGGLEDDFEMIPPDLSLLEKAKHKVYQLNDNRILENVDYEVHLVGADAPEHL